MTDPEKPSVPEQPQQPRQDPQQPPPQQHQQYDPYSYGAYPGSYPPPPPQPYAGYPGYPGYPPPSAPKNGLGIAALVIAVVALLFVWTVFGGVIGGIVAVILGIIGWNRAKRGEATNGGLAIAGTVLGALAVVIGLAFIAIWVGFFSSIGGGDYLSCIQEAGNDPDAQQECEERFRERLEDEFNVSLTPTP